VWGIDCAEEGTLPLLVLVLVLHRVVAVLGPPILVQGVFQAREDLANRLVDAVPIGPLRIGDANARARMTGCGDDVRSHPGQPRDPFSGAL